MDGAYIPDAAVVKGTTSEYIYSPENISCKNVNSVLERNRRKSKLMDYLLSLQNIKGIPYVGYFMSSNLDHALYNIQNLDKELKGELCHMKFQRSKIRPHSANLSEVEIDMKLTEYFAENQIITRKDFQEKAVKINQK